MSKYYKLRRDLSNCHVFEFSPSELRLDATIGKTKKLERLSKITGEPKAGEYAVAKLNGGFFAMNGFLITIQRWFIGKPITVLLWSFILIRPGVPRIRRKPGGQWACHGP